MRPLWRSAALAAVFAAAPLFPAHSENQWDSVVARARGQTVYWNAWGGDARTNAFIDWVAAQVQTRYGVTVREVKLSDTSEAVTRIIAEKAAGRDTDGSIDLIWINGPNFLSLKEKGLLYGPFTSTMPATRLVDTVNKPSTVVDFTVPVDGMESPWRLAQFVFDYDGARVTNVPRSMADIVPWAQRHPGRFTHPDPHDFLGATFLKQALVALTPDQAILQRPASDAEFERVTAPLWTWYDQLRPSLWHGGKDFPSSGPAARQLLNDGEIDLVPSFDPSEAAASVADGSLPKTARTATLAGGSIGNTSFVAIPYNAPHRDAAMVVANFLLEPATQAHAQDIRVLGSFTVLDLQKLSPEQRHAFADLPTSPALPSNAELGPIQLEPHPSWMTRITEAWSRRYTR